jgi:hypothetical protein
MQDYKFITDIYLHHHHLSARHVPALFIAAKLLPLLLLPDGHRIWN